MSLSCRELIEIVTEYLEHQMAPGERERFDRHLAECDGCREYVAQMKETVRALGELPAEPPPDDVRDELLRRFRDWKRPPR